MVKRETVLLPQQVRDLVAAARRVVLEGGELHHPLQIRKRVILAVRHHDAGRAQPPGQHADKSTSASQLLAR
jgi:hypothetical protein